MEEKIQDLVEDLGAKSYKRGTDWNGFKVYIPKYQGNPIIGLPYVVLQKGEEIRLSTPDESMEYLEYEQGNSVSKQGKEELKDKYEM